MSAGGGSRQGSAPGDDQLEHITHWGSGALSTTAKRVQAAYDEIATQYLERERKYGAPPRNELFGAPFLDIVGLASRILDLGCGFGRDTAWFETQGARVVGGDLSAAMLGEARLQVGAALLQLDMRHLPFCAGAFGGVWCSASLLHLPKIEVPATLVEARRILAPGGGLFLALQEGEGEGWENWPSSDAERFFARYRMPEAEALLSAAGFLVRDRQVGETPTRRWLYFLATREGAP